MAISTDDPLNKSSELKISPPGKLQGFVWWRRSMLYRLNMGLSEVEQRQFEFDYTQKNLPDMCKSCVEGRDWMLQYSPTVVFLMDHVKRLGGNLSKININCDVCDDTKGGGFHPQMGILLCANWIQNKWQLEDILAHELVHAYDHLKFKVDTTNLKHHACTEIRALMLSGECRIFNEIKKTGLGNFGKKFQSCVKRRAVLSVKANPNCKSTEEAEKAVETVWQSCFNDTRPFEQIYR